MQKKTELNSKLVSLVFKPLANPYKTSSRISRKINKIPLQLYKNKSSFCCHKCLKSCRVKRNLSIFTVFIFSSCAMESTKQTFILIEFV